jgi:peptidoglycan/LPS O-acetylase OafA/YrhL
LLTFPAFAEVQYGAPAQGLLITALSYTPLHLVWAGPEAVLVFFVLSGLVLSAATQGRSDFRWSAYYPSRLMRLYLPVEFGLGSCLV